MWEIIADCSIRNTKLSLRFKRMWGVFRQYKLVIDDPVNRTVIRLTENEKIAIHMFMLDLRVLNQTEPDGNCDLCRLYRFAHTKE
jgi:hypothetical protein